MDYEDLGSTVATAQSVIDDLFTSTLPPRTARVLGLYDIFIPLLGAFIIVLNLAVVVSSGLILKRGQQPRSTYLFLGNVGLSDLLTGFAVLFGNFYPRELRDEISCAIQIGMIVSSTIASVYSVGLIAIDRFLYILYGLQYQRWIYPNRARLLILLTWIIGIIVGFLPAFGWRGDTDNGRVCWFIMVAPPALVILTTVVGMIPLAVVVVLYGIILHHAIRKVIQLKTATKQHTGVVSGNLRMHVGTASASTSNIMELPSRSQAQLSDTEEPLQPQKKRFFRFLTRGQSPATTTNGNTNNSAAVATSTAGSSDANRGENSARPGTTSKSPSKWKAIKVVMFTAGSFFVTWVPYFVASAMYVNCDPNETPQFCNNLRVAIASPLAILGFANSLTNPIIYAWWHNGFRESAKAIFHSCLRRCRSKDSDSEQQRRHKKETSSSTSSTKDTNFPSHQERQRSSVSARDTSAVSPNVSTTDLDLSDSDVETGAARNRRQKHDNRHGNSNDVSHNPTATH